MSCIDQWLKSYVLLKIGTEVKIWYKPIPTEVQLLPVGLLIPRLLLISSGKTDKGGNDFSHSILLTITRDIFAIFSTGRMVKFPRSCISPSMFVPRVIRESYWSMPLLTSWFSVICFILENNLYNEFRVHFL